MENPTRAYIKQWLYYQAVAGLIIAIGLCLVRFKLGYSSGLGSLVILLANSYQALRVMLSRQQYNPVELLKNFYKGELGKFIILAIFVIVFAKFLNLIWWAFIIGILGTQVGGAALLMMRRAR
ncbi:MAG: hypothetical protein K0S29_183 [Gammaproteobacteria bacterium]|jgi:F0F1-type ATP synthase assembly protein I|nr:hypothetical protein [Gammaproteobacteria bacterium]